MEVVLQNSLSLGPASLSCWFAADSFHQVVDLTSQAVGRKIRKWPYDVSSAENDLVAISSQK